MEATCLGLHGSERRTVPREKSSVAGIGWGFLGHSGAHLVSGVCPRSPARVSEPQGPRGARRAGGGEVPGTKAAATALRQAGAAANSCGLRDLVARSHPKKPAQRAMERPGEPPEPAEVKPAVPPPAPPPPPPPLPPSRPAAPAAARGSANMAAAGIGRDTLPEHWSYGVCRDGRVFFIKCVAGTRGRGRGRGAGRCAGPGGGPPGRRRR